MNNFITYFEIAAFITSLLAWPVIRNSRYLRLFPVLLFVIVSVEVYQTFFMPQDRVNTWVYNIQIPLQHLLYMAILYFSFNRYEYKRFILGAAIAFVLFCVVTDILFLEPDKFNVTAYCFGSVVIIIGIIIKFY